MINLMQKIFGTEEERKKARLARRQDYLLSRPESMLHVNIPLYIPNRCGLDFIEARDIIKSVCSQIGLTFEYARGRSILTGSGKGDLVVACASDEQAKIVGGIAMYETMGRGYTRNPELISDLNGETGEVHPSHSSIAKIKNQKLREFVGLFYEKLYGRETQ